MACFGVGLLASACHRTTLASPQQAVEEWAEAVQRGDAQTVHQLLPAEAARRYTPDQVAELLLRWRPELLRQARALRSGQVQTEVSARVSGRAGWTANLLAVGPEFRVDSAATLPAAARRPEDALRQLRLALEHRSHAALRRVLTRRAAEAMDTQLTDLVTGLAEVDPTLIVIQGRTASVQLPGGRTITLHNEAGIWKIKTFD